VGATIRGLDERERLLGFVAAGMAAILWLIVTVPSLVSPPKHPKPHQLDSTQVAIYLLVGLVLAGLILVATIVRRRAFLGFAVLFTGASFGGDILLALPFWALGGWLLWRAFGVQRAASAQRLAAARERAQAGGARDGSTGSRPGWRKWASTPERAGTLGGSTWQAESGPRRPPTPSKRYTPPKPPPRRPSSQGRSARTRHDRDAEP
jgi:hypothetical protein